MKNFRYFAQRYVDWVIRLSSSSLFSLGIAILTILAIFVQNLIKHAS